MLFLEVILMEDKTKIQILLFKNKKGETKEVECHTCKHCGEVIPVVGLCAECHTPYQHWKTIEIMKGDGVKEEEIGFLYFLFKCSGCNENEQKAQKVLKPI